MISGINNEMQRYNMAFKAGIIEHKVYSAIDYAGNYKLRQIGRTATEKKEPVNEKLLQATVNTCNKLKEDLKKYMLPFSDNLILTLRRYKTSDRYEFRFNNKCKNNEIYEPKIKFDNNLGGFAIGVKQLTGLLPEKIQKDILDTYVRRAKECAMEGSRNSLNPEVLEYIDIIDDIAKTLGEKDYMKENFEPYIRDYMANKIREKELEAQIELNNEALVEKYLLNNPGENNNF